MRCAPRPEQTPTNAVQAENPSARGESQKLLFCAARRRETHDAPGDGSERRCLRRLPSLAPQVAPTEGAQPRPSVSRCPHSSGEAHEMQRAQALRERGCEAHVASMSGPCRQAVCEDDKKIPQSKKERQRRPRRQLVQMLDHLASKRLKTLRVARGRPGPHAHHSDGGQPRS